MLQGDDHTLEDGIKSKLNLGDSSASLSSLPFPAKVYSFRLEASAQEAPSSSSPVDSLVVVFSNRVQVSLTSSGKPGIFLEVTANNAAGNQVGPGARAQRVFSVRTLLGSSSEATDLLGRALAEAAADILAKAAGTGAEFSPPARPCLVSLGLSRDLPLSSVRGLVQAFKAKLEENVPKA